MNKLILLSLTLFFASQITAQTEKGKFRIGANSNLDASFVSTKLSGERTSKDLDFGVEIGASYFVFNNLSAGLSLSFLGTNRKFENSTDAFNTYTFNLGPEITYYLLKGRIKPLLSTSYTFGWRGTSFESDSDVLNTNSTIFNLGAGVAFFISKSISIDVRLNYFNRQDDTEFQDQNNFSFVNPIRKFELVSSGVDTLIGFNFYF